MLMPYRFHAHAPEKRDTVAPSTVVGLRLFGWLFAIASLACGSARWLMGRDLVRAALGVGDAAVQVVMVVVPLLLLIVGQREAFRLRIFSFATAALWTALLIGAAFASRSFGLAIIITVLRAVAFAALLGVAVLSSTGRVIARWPFVTALAISCSDCFERLQTVSDTRLLQGWFFPTLSTMLMFALVAYGFFASAHALGRESINDEAVRLSASRSRLFASDAARSSFVVPVRFVTELVAALAIVSLMASTTTFAYSFALRRDSPPAGADFSVVAVLLAASLIVLRRPAGLVGILGALVAVFSTWKQSSSLGGLALLVVAAPIVELVTRGPRPSDGASLTTRRWVVSTSAAAILLGSAGFFALTSPTNGEPALAKLAKAAAVIFAIAGAHAATKLARWARIELAAEAREP